MCYNVDLVQAIATSLKLMSRRRVQLEEKGGIYRQKDVILM